MLTHEKTYAKACTVQAERIEKKQQTLNKKANRLANKKIAIVEKATKRFFTTLCREKLRDILKKHAKDLTAYRIHLSDKKAKKKTDEQVCLRNIKLMLALKSFMDSNDYAKDTFFALEVKSAIDEALQCAEEAYNRLSTKRKTGLLQTLLGTTPPYNKILTKQEQQQVENIETTNNEIFNQLHNSKESVTLLGCKNVLAFLKIKTVKINTVLNGAGKKPCRCLLPDDSDLLTSLLDCADRVLGKKQPFKKNDLSFFNPSPSAYLKVRGGAQALLTTALDPKWSNKISVEKATIPDAKLVTQRLTEYVTKANALRILSAYLCRLNGANIVVVFIYKIGRAYNVAFYDLEFFHYERTLLPFITSWALLHVQETAPNGTVFTVYAEDNDPHLATRKTAFKQLPDAEKDWLASINATKLNKQAVKIEGEVLLSAIAEMSIDIANI